MDSISNSYSQLSYRNNRYAESLTFSAESLTSTLNLSLLALNLSP